MSNHALVICSKCGTMIRQCRCVQPCGRITEFDVCDKCRKSNDFQSNDSPASSGKKWLQIKAQLNSILINVARIEAVIFENMSLRIYVGGDYFFVDCENPEEEYNEITKLLTAGNEVINL